jgi:hypothetical protein
MFKKASKSVSYSSTSPAIKIPENTDEDPDNPKPADEGDIQIEYSSDYLCSPSVRPVTKNSL